MKTQHIMHKTGLRLMMVLLSFFVLTGCDGQTPKPSKSQIKEMAQNLKVGSLIFRVGRATSTDNWRSSPFYGVFVVSKIDGDDVLLGFLLKAKIANYDGFINDEGKKIPSSKVAVLYENTGIQEYEALKKNPTQYASIHPIYRRNEASDAYVEDVEPSLLNATKPTYFYNKTDGVYFVGHYSKKAIMEKGVLDRCVEGRPFPDGWNCPNSNSDAYIDMIIAP